jgi:hypothetical protein
MTRAACQVSIVRKRRKIRIRRRIRIRKKSSK